MLSLRGAWAPVNLPEVRFGLSWLTKALAHVKKEKEKMHCPESSLLTLLQIFHMYYWPPLHKMSTLLKGLKSFFFNQSQFSSGIVVKNPPANARDSCKRWGLIPGWERCPGEGNGTPLQDSCLENSMDTAHKVTKSWTWLSELSTHEQFLLKIPFFYTIFLCPWFPMWGPIMEFKKSNSYLRVTAADLPGLESCFRVPAPTEPQQPE